MTTGIVDDFRPTSYVTSACVSELNGGEQLLLARALPALLALSNRTVAITAKSRSGKDHVANRIREYKLLTSNIRALAEPIGEIAKTIYGKLEGKHRNLFILIEQELRKEDSNIWFKVWLRRNIELFLKGEHHRFICPDLRQPTDYDFFKHLGAVIVKIEADEEKRLGKIAELDGVDALNEELLKDTERSAGSFETNNVLVNNYDDQFNADIEEFIANVLVAQKGW
ncbi:hypothetical protein [Paenibacillus sp. NPDC057967]|uniref:hypothetical protein n=1 Tax=Paenibacillus sp. NPDC057967 TaxID=3346293 RepID=UPI0036DBAECB